MAVVLQAASLEEDRLSFASYSYSSEYGGESRIGDDEYADSIEYEDVEPVAAKDIRVFGDGSILPAGAFLSHGALMTIDGVPGTFVYKDEHVLGTKRTSDVKLDAHTEGQQELALALADRAAAPPQELEHRRVKPYWSRVEAVPKPALYLYRSLISAEVIKSKLDQVKGFECTFGKVYVPESWERSDLSWVKKGAWVEFNPENKLLAPKLGMICIDPIPSRGFSEIKIRFTDGTESDYIQTDSSYMQRCVVTQLVFVCDEHDAQSISRTLRRAREHGHPKHHEQRYKLKLKGKDQVTLELATKGLTVTEHPEGPVKYNYRRVYPTADGRIRKRHPMRSARTPSGDFPDADPPPNTPLYESNLGLDPPVAHFLGNSPKPEALLEPWVKPEPEPEQVPPSWREKRQAEIEAELDARQQLSDQGIFARLFGCGRRSKTRNTRKNKNDVYALDKGGDSIRDGMEDQLGLSELNAMQMEPISEEEEDLMLLPYSQSSDDQSDYSLQQQPSEEPHSPGRVYEENTTDENEQELANAAIIDRAVPGDAVAPRRYEALSSSPIFQDAVSNSKELDELAKGEVIVALAAQEVDGIGWVQCSLGWVRLVDNDGNALLSLVASVDTQAPPIASPEPVYPRTDELIATAVDMDYLQLDSPDIPAGTDIVRSLQDTVNESSELQIEDADLAHPEDGFEAATEAANGSGRTPEELTGLSWVELRSTLLQNKPGAVVTMEGAVWWPHIRPPLTSKQNKALKKREKLRNKLVTQNTTVETPASPLQAQAPDTRTQVERHSDQSLSTAATHKAVTEAVADLLSEVEAMQEFKEPTNVADQDGDHDRKLVEAMREPTVESTLKPEVAEKSGLVTKYTEAEQAVPDDTMVTLEPDVLQPRDTLEERLAKMDSLQDRWMKRTKIEEQQLVKTANMVTVETFMDEEYAFNLKTAEELVNELTWAPPPAQHAVSEWFHTIGLGHIEPHLQDRIYNDRFEDEFLQTLCGPSGMASMESLDGSCIAELIKLLDLGPQAEVVFRQELHRRTKNPEHAPLPVMVMANDGFSKNAKQQGTTPKKVKKNKKKKKKSTADSLTDKEEEHEETAKEQFERIMREEEAAKAAAEAAAQAALLEDSERAAGRGKKKEKKKKKNGKKKTKVQDNGDVSPKPRA